MTYTITIIAVLTVLVLLTTIPTPNPKPSWLFHLDTLALPAGYTIAAVLLLGMAIAETGHTGGGELIFAAVLTLPAAYLWTVARNDYRDKTINNTASPTT